MVTSQLSSVGVNFDDEVRALLMLCSLPERWNGLVMAVSNSIFGSSTLKFDDVVSVINPFGYLNLRAPCAGIIWQIFKKKNPTSFSLSMCCTYRHHLNA